MSKLGFSALLNCMIKRSFRSKCPKDACHAMSSERMRSNSLSPGFVSAVRLAARHVVLATWLMLGLVSPISVIAQTVLPKGTVPVLRGVVSGSVVVNTPVLTPTGANLTINQIDPQVIIDWNSFNVANGSVVQFIQPSSTASALNRIYSSDPSVIQGQILANGQIFLINQNGILFDRGAQINVNTLYASSLNITNAQFTAGVVPASPTTPTFAGGYDNSGNTIASTTTGSIQIGTGGSPNASAPKITSGLGGAIVLMAPMINNQSGVITSPDGQVILAAGNKGYLQFPDASDTTLRGLVVEIDAANGPLNVTSMITNMGTLQADRGNVTLAALAVNQGGTISASTALQKNGSIYLQATNSTNTAVGNINLLPGSVIQTPLDTTDTSTLPASQSYDNYRAQVTLTGTTIVDQGTINSPAGIVTINAADPTHTVTPRIYMAPNSVINVAGDNATAPFSDDMLTFKVTSNELANSPDQKGGLLEGSTVTVDLNAGSTLLDLSAYQGAVKQTLAEKASSAGTVTLDSTGDIIQRVGSQINANGGTIGYSGGKDPVTLLLGSDNNVYSITNAPEALTYTSLLGAFDVAHPHWGQTEVYGNQVYGVASQVAAFTNGSNAGTVDIFPGTALVLDGQVTASTIVGVNQLQNAPLGGTLAIGQFNPTPGAPQEFGVKNVVFANGTTDSLGAGFSATSALTAAQADTTRLSSSLFASSVQDDLGVFHQNGFQSLTIGADQSVVIPKGVTVSGALGGDLTIRGQQILVDGNIALPAGSIALDSTVTTAPLAAGAGYLIDVAGSVAATGQWSNSIGNGFGSTPLPSTIAANGSTAAITTANGGSISLTAPPGVVSQSAIVLEAGSSLDVSAGGSINAKGKASGGNAGSISIQAANSTSGDNRTLTLDGTLTGYGFTNGGALSIADSDAIIGASATQSAGSNVFAPTFFNQGGFSSYSIAGTNGVSVTAGTNIAPDQQNYVLSQTAAYGLPSGANVQSAALVQTLPDYTRGATSIALSAPLGAVTLAAGSTIVTDPKATVTLAGGTGGLEVAGRIVAPGGNVNLTDTNASAAPSLLQLASTASVDVSGTYIPGAPNLLGLVTGSVVQGGDVTITATNANLEADLGSQIAVNGAAHPISQTQLQTQAPTKSSQFVSNAGAILISANDQVAFNSSISGHASAGAAGGSFSLSYLNRNDTFDSDTKRRIVVTDAVTTDTGDPAYSDAAIALDPLRAGGFDKLSLSAEDAIQFNGPSVNAAFARGVTLNSQQFSVADGTVASVSGAAVVLSNSFGQRILNTSGSGTVLDNTLASLPIATTKGTGQLSVQADTLDLMGSLTINGVSQTTLASAGDTRLTGRIVGLPTDTNGASLVGSLITEGNLTFTSSQLYPTTRSSFTVAVADASTGNNVTGGVISFQGNKTTPDAVLSAGGSLTVTADNISQGGSVEAPLGTLALNGATSLTLLPGSTTSTSAHGQVVPYGGTSAGVSWLYASTNDEPLFNALTAPPVKAMSLTGTNVQIENGAKVDVSGGGNILGIEFVPGSGGSVDALAANGTYAIIPTSQLGAAPIDTAIATIQNLNQSSPTSVYNSIHIDAGGPVPAGDYALLPGYYALLPGAYIVQVQSGTKYAGLQPGQTVSLANGLTVVPAYEEVAGTNVHSSNTIGVVVQSGSNANKLADYNQFGASFFTDVAVASGKPLPVVPNDAGQLTLSASQTLSLDGKLLTSPGNATGNAAQIDITGSEIAVVDATGQSNVPTGYLQIDASSLSAINGSVLLGGTRTSTATTVTVNPDASSILIANSAADPLQTPELLLASTGTITLLPGSVIAAQGQVSSSSTTARPITIDATNSASGAFIRASDSNAVIVTRGAAPNTSAGVITVDAGASLGATGSLLLDATADTISNGTFALSPKASLSLVSSTISLGDAPANTSGLTLDQGQLAAFNNIGSLTLKSYTGINVYGADIALGGPNLQSLTLDTNSIVAEANGATPTSFSANGNTVTFTNTSGTSLQSASSGSGGRFGVTAQTVVLGEGSKTVSGFDAVAISAGTVTSQGVGQFDAAAPLSVAAAVVTGESGSNQNITAANFANGSAGQHFAVALGPSGIAATPVVTPVLVAQTTTNAASPVALSGLGAQITINAADITSGSDAQGKGTTLLANAGNITLNAVGGGAGAGIALGAGTQVDVSGKSQTFQSATAIADAGNVVLNADHGAISLDPTSTISVAGASAGGNAGSLNITAPTVALGGTLDGKAASGQTQGSFSLDTGSLASFSALNSTVQSGGFGQSLDLRVRSGDIAIASSDVVSAHNIVISADAGSITLNGASPGGPGAVIDSSAPAGGGSVSLSASGNIDLQSGSAIRAAGQSTDTSSDHPAVNGGSVALSSAGTIVFEKGATIDVSGGASGIPGTVSFTAPRTAGNAGVMVELNGTVLSKSYGNAGAAEVDVYGNQVYNVGTTLLASSTDPSVNTLATIIGDNQTFMSTVDALALGAQLTGDGGSALTNVHVRPAVEIRSSGNLTLDPNDTGNIDLTDPTAWLLTNNASPLTPESGTLTVRAAGTLTLSNVSVGLPDNSLYAGNTWNLNLVGGADLSAANVMQTQGASALGTSGSVVLDGPAARVTSGNGNIRIAAGYDFGINNQGGVVYTSGVPVPGETDIYQRWAEGGGNIFITAQHDAIGSSNEWVTDWFRRTASGVTGDLGTWWALRANFQQGVGALGGGDVTIIAGNDVDNLSASIPTSGRVTSPNPLTLPKGRSKVLGPGPFYLDVEGGGDLVVKAGNDISGGQYFVGNGTGNITAGGSVGSGNAATQLYLMGENQVTGRQQASISVVAGGDVNLQSINDPTLVGQTRSTTTVSDPSISPANRPSVNFNSYSPNSAVTVQSKGGDIFIYGEPSLQVPLNPADGTQAGKFGDPSTSIDWPAYVSLIAFNGSVSSRPSQIYTTYPSSQGGIDVLANTDISSVNLIQSDLGPPGSGANAVSNWRYPIKPQGNGSTDSLGLLTSYVPSSTGYVDEVISETGTISDSVFQFPAVSRIYAGVNIDNVQLTLQNTVPSDVSEIIAGTGFFHPTTAGTSIAGPGQLLIETGGDIDLGAGSQGVPALVATGNSLNSSLASDQSARITMIAGVTGPINLANLDATFQALITDGIDKNQTAAKNAVNAFFAGDQINPGNIDTYLTSVQTDQGSGIDLLAPAGNITVGLTTPPLNTTVGIVTNAGGAIRSYLSGDFSINQGKVLTAVGGDIEIYSADGNIDAGRGAKTSLTIPPPQRNPIQVDGVTVGYTYTVSTAAAGSGIQTLTSDIEQNGSKPPPAGSIYLFAPAGTVDAGEAGIVSGANIFIEAQTVLNASNISASGTSTGVPTVQTGSLASSLAASGSNSTSATDKAAEDAARAAVDAASSFGEAFTTAILTVEVLGFGSNHCKETDKNCLGVAQ